jgi:hypothetical protein
LVSKTIATTVININKQIIRDKNNPPSVYGVTTQMTRTGVQERSITADIRNLPLFKVSRVVATKLTILINIQEFYLPGLDMVGNILTAKITGAIFFHIFSVFPTCSMRKQNCNQEHRVFFKKHFAGASILAP